MYASDIKAYIYDDTLIINDHVNIVAVNAHNGSYVWSMTNKEDLFKNEEMIPQDGQFNPKKALQARRLFVRDIMFHTGFLNERLIVMHKNKIYSLKPLTGYCEKSRQLNMEGVTEIKIGPEQIYILPYSLGSIKILSSDLEDQAEIPIKHLEIKPKAWPEFLLINNFILLNTGENLYIIDKQGARLKSEFNTTHLGEYYVEVDKDNLLIIEPFSKITSYHLEGAFLVPNFIFDLKEQQDIWNLFYQESQAYFIATGSVFFPYQENSHYYLVAIDTSTGKRLWQTLLPGVKGPFYSLFNFNSIKGTSNFIISTVHSEGKNMDDIRSDIDEIRSNIVAPINAVPVDSKLFCLNNASGNILKSMAIAAGTAVDYSVAIFETRDCLIYSLYKYFLKIAVR
jgi:outer membrane protein assembly factor BamB